MNLCDIDQIKALLALQLVVLIQNVRKLLRQCDLLFEDRRLFDLPAKRLQVGDPLLIRSGTDHAPAAAPPERSGEKYHRRGKHAEQYHLNSADPARRCGFSHHIITPRSNVWKKGIHYAARPS